jgi:hypothetical protein
MYSKIKIAGHPVHPMLVAFPVVCYTGTLVAFAVYGIPRDSAAKLIGLAHATLNVAALGLFAAVLASYVSNWNGPAIGATLGIVLSAIGVAATLGAGFLGWTLVQDYHVGIQLAPEQELAEATVQHHQPPIPLRRRHAA